MKKTLHIISLLLVLVALAPNHVYAKRIVETEETSNVNSKTERYIKYVYDKIKFGKTNKLRFEPFRNAFYGYLNMLEAGKINASSTLTICDFTLSSNVKRMWVMDMQRKKVLFNSLVAHGMGTGEEFAENFSNTEDSHQSSLGFYVTGETYEGNNGYSLKLNGLDGSFNNKAYDRAIVIHGADYVSEEFALSNKRIGRSHGCPALPVELAPKVIDKIQNGQCLFIYFNAKNYLKQSYWLNNKIAHLPQEADYMDLNTNAKSTKNSLENDTDDCATECKKANPTIKKTVQECIAENALTKKPMKYIILHEGPNGTTTSDTLIVK